MSISLKKSRSVLNGLRPIWEATELAFPPFVDRLCFPLPLLLRLPALPFVELHQLIEVGLGPGGDIERGAGVEGPR